MVIINGMNGIQFFDGNIIDTPKHVFESELHNLRDTHSAHNKLAELIKKFINEEDMENDVEIAED